jgi:hypothetical protein
MTVNTNCKDICTELRHRGFVEEGLTSVIPEDALKNAINTKGWSDLNAHRYRGADGYLVQHGFLKIVEGGYQLTGADLNE